LILRKENLVREICSKSGGSMISLGLSISVKGMLLSVVTTVGYPHQNVMTVCGQQDFSNVRSYCGFKMTAVSAHDTQNYIMLDEFKELNS